MARTQVYTCDICKQSKDEKSLAKISVSVEGIRIKDADKYNPLKIDICKDCLKKKGFIVDKKVDDGENVQTQGKNKMTLEEKIYDILEDMGVSFTE